MPARMVPAAALYFLVLASSAVELVYEVLWMRRFTVLFGATAPAAAVAISAVFLGMSAGSAVVGRVAARWSSALRAFALLELGMALSALLLEPVLRLYDVLLPGLYPILSGRPAAFLAVKAGLALAAVAVPAFFMGGTIPLAGQALHEHGSRGARLGATLGGLLGASLLGACGGTLLVPVALLPFLGADGAYAAAITANLAVAGLAVLGGKRARRGDPATAMRPVAMDAALRSPAVPVEAAVSTASTSARFLAFFSGALVLGLEVLWTRMFSRIHENSLYSFASILAVFLLGLSGGAWLARWLLSRGLSPGRAAAWAWSLAGLLVVASPRFFHELTSGMAYSPGVDGPGPLAARPLVLAAVLLFPATVLCGIFLPALLEGSRRKPGEGKVESDCEREGAIEAEPAGRILGRLLAWNTAGSIAGPLVAAFGIGPRLGLWWSIASIGILLVAGGQVAGVVLARDGSLRRSAPRGLGNAFAALAALSALTAVVSIADPGGVPRARWDAERGQKLVGIVEGVNGTLAVLQDETSRWVTFNNHYTLGGTASAGDERQQAHLPLLLHPAPRKVAFLGLGTGITAGAALLHPVEAVTVLEILPEAVEAAREYFGHANYRVVEDPRVEVVLDDARTFLRSSGRRFDVIVGDLVTPWRPGEALLYSLEHFQAARGALEPGGIFCQWLPLFQLTEEGLAIAAATFLDVFPGATLWRGDFLPDQPALALIGTTEPGPLDPATVDARARDLAPRLDHANPYLADPAGFWLFLIGPLDANDPRFASARRNRDARPWIELLSPFTQRGGAESTSASSLVGRRLEAALDGVQKRSLEGTWLERLSPQEGRWRDAGAALWHASLLAREKRGGESFALARRTLATLPEKLQIAVTGGVVKE